MKTECDYLYGWIKKKNHTQKKNDHIKNLIEMVNPRDIAGNAEEDDEREWAPWNKPE